MLLLDKAEGEDLQHHSLQQLSELIKEWYGSWKYSLVIAEYEIIRNKSLKPSERKTDKNNFEVLAISKVKLENPEQLK